MTVTRLFPQTVPASTHSIARSRALSLYREWLREIPRTIRKYPLDISIALGRARVRQEFEKYRHVRDLAVVNGLILKGTQELIETHNMWKQPTHAMRYFDADEQLPQEGLPQIGGRNIERRSAMSAFLSDFLGK